jgi:hypothetical protein
MGPSSYTSSCAISTSSMKLAALHHLLGLTSHNADASRNILAHVGAASVQGPAAPFRAPVCYHIFAASRLLFSAHGLKKDSELVVLCRADARSAESPKV